MSAYIDGLKLLGRRELSVQQLRSRLIEREHTPEETDEAVAKLSKEGTADIAVVARQVGQAEQARANLTTKRTVMLYRMHRLLTPEQRSKLDAMFARREAERRKNDPNGRR